MRRLRRAHGATFQIGVYGFYKVVGVPIKLGHYKKSRKNINNFCNNKDQLPTRREVPSIARGNYQLAR